MLRFWTSHDAVGTALLSMWLQMKDRFASRQFALVRPQQSALARSKCDLSKNGLKVRRSRVAEIRVRAKKDEACPGRRLPSRVLNNNLKPRTDNCLIRSADPALRPHAGGSSRAASPCLRRSCPW